MGSVSDLAGAASVLAPALGSAVALLSLVLKIRESNRRTRAHNIAVESYALAKSIGELSSKDAGAAIAPSIRNDLIRAGHQAARRYERLVRPKRRITLNWVGAAGYSGLCVLAGNGMLQAIDVFHVTAIPWVIALLGLGAFLLILGLIVFGTQTLRLFRRRRAIFRFVRVAWHERMANRELLEAPEGAV